MYEEKYSSVARRLEFPVPFASDSIDRANTKYRIAIKVGGRWIWSFLEISMFLDLFTYVGHLLVVLEIRHLLFEMFLEFEFRMFLALFIYCWHFLVVLILRVYTLPN